jgi:hypothetical protein
MNDLSDTAYLKNAPTTPPKDSYIKPYFPFDPEYTFGTQIIQNVPDIDTPLLKDTTKHTIPTKSLRPNGGRSTTLYGQGTGRGSGRGGRSGGINPHPTSRISSSTSTTKLFTMNGTDNDINKLNNINHIDTNTLTNTSTNSNNTNGNKNTNAINQTEQIKTIKTHNACTNQTNIEMSDKNNSIFDCEHSNTLQSTRNNTVTFQPITKVPMEH